MADNLDHKTVCRICGHAMGDMPWCPACGHVPAAPQQAEAAKPDPPAQPPSYPVEAEDEPIALSSVYALLFLLPKPPKGIPRACWERVRRLRYVLVAVELVWLACLFAPSLLNVVLDALGTDIPWSVFNRLWYPALVLAFVGGIVFPRLLRRAVRRLHIEIEGNNLEHCLECGYPLRGLPDEHRCPECGKPYNIAVITKTWERYFEVQQGRR